jgi:hypothetical protein
MSFLFRPGQKLIRNNTPHVSTWADRRDSPPPGCNSDSDNDVRDDFCYTDSPHWNSAANMPQDMVDAILDEDTEIPRFDLPPELQGLSFQITSIRLQKLAIPLIASFNNICPHPGSQFHLLSLANRSDFLSMIISAPILPPMEYFAQFNVLDFNSMYSLLIDSFSAELTSFNTILDASCPGIFPSLWYKPFNK